MRLLVAGALLWAALVFTGCGGSSDHDNARVMGIVSDCDGNPVSDVILTLLPDDYNPVRDTALVIEKKAVTNSSGSYEFDGIPEGRYTLTLIDQFNSRGLIKKGVQVVGERICLDTLHVKNYGIVAFNPDAFNLKKGAAVYIPGTSFFHLIDSAEVFFQVPPGIVVLSAFDVEEGTDIVFLEDYQRVEIVSTRVLNIGYNDPAPLYLDSLGQGYNEFTGKTGVAYKFTAEYPVVVDYYSSYRFSWGDDPNENGQWMDYCVQEHVWSKPGVYRVQYQKMYKGSLHSWSSTLVVTILE